MDQKEPTDPVETSEVAEWAYRILRRRVISPDGDGGHIAGPPAQRDFRQVLEVGILAHQEDSDLSTFRMYASDGSVFGVTITREET